MTTLDARLRAVIAARLQFTYADRPMRRLGEEHSATHWRSILDRHQPRTDHAGRLECVWCDSLCHSGSGLGCDTPDAPWPCDEIRDLATRLAVAVDDGEGDMSGDSSTATWQPARPGDTPGQVEPGEGDAPRPLDLAVHAAYELGYQAGYQDGLSDVKEDVDAALAEAQRAYFDSGYEQGLSDGGADG